MLEIERGSTRSYAVESWLWKRLWTCRENWVRNEWMNITQIHSVLKLSDVTSNVSQRRHIHSSWLTNNISFAIYYSLKCLALVLYYGGESESWMSTFAPAPRCVTKQKRIPETDLSFYHIHHIGFYINWHQSHLFLSRCIRHADGMKLGNLASGWQYSAVAPDFVNVSAGLKNEVDDAHADSEANSYILLSLRNEIVWMRFAEHCYIAFHIT